MNAVPTSTRLRFLQHAVADSCHLCRQGQDSIEHLVCQCSVVQGIKRAIGLSDEDPCSRWVFSSIFAPACRQMQGGRSLSIGTTNMRVALADALCHGRLDDEAIWDVKLLVLQRNHEIVDFAQSIAHASAPVGSRHSSSRVVPT